MHKNRDLVHQTGPYAGVLSCTMGTPWPCYRALHVVALFTLLRSARGCAQSVAARLARLRVVSFGPRRGALGALGAGRGFN